MKHDLDKIQGIANEVAEDYPGRLNEDCYYSSPCLVGEILNRLDVTVEPRFDGSRFSRIPWARLDGDDFAPDAIAFLQRIQDRSDAGALWGEAVADG